MQGGDSFVAAGLNAPIFCSVRGSIHHRRRQQVLGTECSGVISEVGPGSSWQVGDRVCALLAGGGMVKRLWWMRATLPPVPGSWGRSRGYARGVQHRLAEPVPTGRSETR